MTLAMTDQVRHFQSKAKNMDEELRQQIRTYVQEEIAHSTPPNRVTTQSLIARTRSLMQNAATSSTPTRTGSYHTPNHPNRIGKKRKVVSKTTTHELQVLHPPDNTDEIEHCIGDESICIKEALIDLQSTLTEDEIRQKIVQVCKSKLPSLRTGDFDFVKRSNNKICKPVVGEDFKYDYPQLKRLAGQGKVYIRLNNLFRRTQTRFFTDESSSDEELPVFRSSGPRDNKKPRMSIEEMKFRLREDPENWHKFDPSKDSGSSQVATVTCPICFKRFCKTDIQSHAGNCGEDPFSFKSDGDETLPFNEEEETTSATENHASTFDELDSLLLVQKESANQVLRVIRSRSWSMYVAHCNKKWFKRNANINISFTGENAVGNGPTREFFQVALRQMQDQLIGDGTFKASPLLLQENIYFYAGQLMAQSLLQGGPAPAVLSKWAYSIIAKPLTKTTYKCIDIPTEYYEQDTIKKLCDPNIDQEYQTALMEDQCFDLLCKIGYTGNPAKEKIENLQDIIKTLYFTEKLLPILPALYQLSDGLNIRGLVELIRNSPELYEDLFIIGKQEIKCDILVDNLEPIYSPSGSNNFIREKELFQLLLDYVEFISYDETSNVKLKDLLFFLSGCDRLPYGGFEETIKVHFKHDCAGTCQCFPTVSLCGLVMVLPSHIKEMNTVMCDAIRSSPGFGRL